VADTLSGAILISAIKRSPASKLKFLTTWGCDFNSRSRYNSVNKSFWRITYCELGLRF
jgi:hypothetical protein